MDLALAGVAESLTTEFGELRSSTVLAVVTGYARITLRADPHVVEQAARARLLLLRQQQRRRRRVGRTSLPTAPVAG